MKNLLLEQMKVTTDQATEVINVMFSRLNSKERTRILNLIDCFVQSFEDTPRKCALVQ